MSIADLKEASETVRKIARDDTEGSVYVAWQQIEAGIETATALLEAARLTLEMLTGEPGVHADEKAERPYRIADLRAAIASATGEGVTA